MTNRCYSFVARIGATFVVLSGVLSVFAKTPLPTQYIAPVATPDWEHAILKTAYGQDQGFTFKRSGGVDGGYYYYLWIDEKPFKIADHVLYAYDRTIGMDQLTPSHEPAETIVRSVTAKAGTKSAPARRYLYNNNNTIGEKFSPIGTDISNPINVENFAINYGFDSTPHTASYVQCVHTDWCYKVTFYANGGSGSMATQTYTNSAQLSANAFTRTGYTFDGWATSASGAKAYDDKAAVSKDLNLYARWKVNSYTVTLSKGTGVSELYYRIGTSGSWNRYTAPFSANYGSTVQGYAAAAAGYTAANPQSSPWSQAVSADALTKTFTATANDYTITFNPIGGSVMPMTKSATYLANYPSLPTPTHTNTYATAGYVTSYAFAGWYTAQSGGEQRSSSDTYTTAGNQTLYAHWTEKNTAKRYTLAYNGNGATSGSMGTQSAFYGSSITLLTCGFSRTGYSFAGWSKSAGETAWYLNQATITVNDEYVKFSTYADGATVTLYAQWTSRQCTVSFDGNGGSSPSSKNVAFGEKYGTLPSPLRTGYVFAGWRTALSGGTQVTSETQVRNPENHVLYAHWTAVQYEIDYQYLKPGATHTNPATYTIEDEIVFVPPTPVDGFAFTGWDPSSIGKGSTGKKTVKAKYLTKVDKPTVGNLTYNGKWQTCASSATSYSVSGDVQESYPGTYTVTFKLNSGYCWSDGTQGDYSVDWQILKAQITDVTVEQKDPLVYTGKPQTALLTRTATLQGGQTASWTYSTLQDGSFSGTVPAFTDIGSHTVYYKVDAKYHDQASGSFQVVIGAALTLKGNGGTIGGLAETNFPCALGAPYPVLPAAVRDGFAFVGWWTDRDFTNGVQKTTNDLVTVEALTLYARWKAPSDATTCTVTLDLGGKGTVEESAVTRTVGAALGDLPVPTANDPAAHLFFGWYDASGNAVTGDTVVESDLSLTAKWSEKKFNERLGTDLLCFTTTTEYPWVVDETGIHSGEILGEAVSDLYVEVPQRGLVQFKAVWKMQDDVSDAYFGWSTDGEVAAKDKRSGTGSEEVSLSVDIGKRLELRHGALWGEDTDRAWLTSLTWTPDPGETAIDGWDSAKNLVCAPANAIFETGGAAEWTVTDIAGEFFAGENGIASVTNLSHGRSTWTRMTVNGPGVVTFKWKVSSEKGYVDAGGQYVKCDYLEFCDGEAPVAFIDGETGFTTFTYTNVTAGTHTFSWRYVKDGTGAAGADRGFVDALTWTPTAPEHPVPEAKDAVTISSAAVAGGKFSLSFKSDEKFDYNLRTNANLLIDSWGVMATEKGTGESITFGPLVIDGLPQLFYKVETIQRKD